MDATSIQPQLASLRSWGWWWWWFWVLPLNYFVLGMSQTRVRNCSALNLKRSRGGIHYLSAFAGPETQRFMLAIFFHIFGHFYFLYGRSKK